MKRKMIKNLLAFLFLILFASYCSSELREYQGDPTQGGGKLAISGSFCADNPSDVELPVKILFLVDQSGSLVANDPDYCRSLGFPSGPSCPGDKTNMRQEAIRNIWLRYVINPSYSFGIVTFANSVVPITQNPDGYFLQGFDVEPYISSLVTTDNAGNPTVGSTTDIFNTLDLARNIIQSDLSNTPQLDRNKNRYVVILFTDGIPDDGIGSPYPTGGAPLEDKDSIVNMAEEISNLKAYWDAGDITINTAYLNINTTSPEPAQVIDARDLLQSIQLVGNGLYSEFNPIVDPGDVVTFDGFDLTSFVRTFSIKSFVVYNRNAKIDSTGSMLADSDGDGLPDPADNRLKGNSDLFISNSDEGACLDFAENALGLDPQDPLDDCSLTNIPGIDTDGDTCPDVLEDSVLTDINDPSDCNITQFMDSDSDGCSDYIENLNSALDPFNSLDCLSSVLRDTDFDYCGDFVEVSIGSDPFNPFDCDCPEDKRSDSDFDGLLDCEEELLGYATTQFDSDRDGLTDFSEFHGGSNAVSLEEGILDTDMDGWVNNTEVREHTNPKYTDGSERSRIAYDYDLTNLGMSIESVYCYEFSVKNITLFNTQPDINGRDGVNNLSFYIIESPQDINLSNTQGVMRVKELKIRIDSDGNKFMIEDDDITETPIGSTLMYEDADIKEFTLSE